jgi:hypothetical protein
VEKNANPDASKKQKAENAHEFNPDYLEQCEGHGAPGTSDAGPAIPEALSSCIAAT